MVPKGITFCLQRPRLECEWDREVPTAWNQTLGGTSHKFSHAMDSEIHDLSVLQGGLGNTWRLIAEARGAV